MWVDVERASAWKGDEDIHRWASREVGRNHTASCWRGTSLVKHTLEQVSAEEGSSVAQFVGNWMSSLGPNWAQPDWRDQVSTGHGRLGHRQAPVVRGKREHHSSSS